MLEEQMVNSPFGRAGAGAPNYDHLSRSKFNRDAHMDETDQMSRSLGMQNSRLAGFGNSIMDNNNNSTGMSGAYHTDHDQGNWLRNSSRYDYNYLVPGFGTGYVNREEQDRNKKARIKDELARTYELQIAERNQRREEERRRQLEEERAQEERARKERIEIQEKYELELQKKRTDVQEAQRKLQEVHKAYDEREKERTSRILHQHHNSSRTQLSDSQVQKQPQPQTQSKQEVSQEQTKDDFHDVEMSDEPQNNMNHQSKQDDDDDNKLVEIDKMQLGQMSDQVNYKLKSAMNEQFKRIKHEVDEHNLFMQKQLLTLKVILPLTLTLTRIPSVGRGYQR